MIKQCPSGCSKKPHAQDELHGKGMRVFNEHTSPKNGNLIRRCTVCGYEEATPRQEKK